MSPASPPGVRPDMRTGRHAGDPKVRLRPIPAIRRDGQVYLSID